MKKLLAIILCVALICVCFAGCGSSGENVIKIGIFEPLSGQNAPGGKQEALGIKFANSKVNTVTVGGVEYKIELVEADNASDDTKAITAAQSLIDQGVSVVLGSYGSSVSIAAGTYFKQAQIPAIGCSCTNAAVTEGNEYYYRVCFLDPFQGTVMANFAYGEKGAKNALVVTEAGDAYSEGLGSCFVEAFEKLGGKTTTKNFQTNETNYKSLLQVAVDSDIDCIFAPSSITSAPLIIKQARELGITCPIMAGDTWENQSIIENAGDSATDVYLSTFFDENDETASEFVKEYKEFLNSDKQNLTNNGGNDGVAAVSALGYDAYMTAIEAIKKADSIESAKILEALATLEVAGVTGDITFDKNGDAEKDIAYIKTVKDGGFTFVKKQEVK